MAGTSICPARMYRTTDSPSTRGKRAFARSSAGEGVRRTNASASAPLPTVEHRQPERAHRLLVPRGAGRIRLGNHHERRRPTHDHPAATALPFRDAWTIRAGPSRNGVICAFWCYPRVGVSSLCVRRCPAFRDLRRGSASPIALAHRMRASPTSAPCVQRRWPSRRTRSQDRSL